MKARKGIWTPWAQVLCHECHGPTLVGGAFDGSSTSLRGFAGKEAITNINHAFIEATPCNDCGAMCWVRLDVARLNTLRLALKELTDDRLMSDLAQTGGMCCGLTITPHLQKPGDGNPTTMTVQSDEVEHEFVMVKYKDCKPIDMPEDWLTTDCPKEIADASAKFLL